MTARTIVDLKGSLIRQEPRSGIPKGIPYLALPFRNRGSVRNFSDTAHGMAACMTPSASALRSGKKQKEHRPAAARWN